MMQNPIIINMPLISSTVHCREAHIHSSPIAGYRTLQRAVKIPTTKLVMNLERLITVINGYSEFCHILFLSTHSLHVEAGKRCWLILKQLWDEWLCIWSNDCTLQTSSGPNCIVRYAAVCGHAVYIFTCASCTVSASMCDTHIYVKHACMFARWSRFG